ncbi:uncharacterized protein LOC142543494 [Primulina tabacum]|uniref:uncharacterized protein LOC142543494 n=1 Tax=Primulina tabacum TaxID=48773 RepID=UPI003F5A131B
MAETQPKRHREEPQSLDFEEANPCTKRHKPYNNILSLLEEEEEEDETEPTSEPPNEDLSAMFTTLQQELSSSTSCDSTAFDDFDFVPYSSVEGEVEELTAHHQISTESSTSAVCSPRSSDGEGEDEGVKSVMRHLLEASDDELGIPNREDNDVVEMKSGENFPFALSDHGLWELEDETANYYTVLQSELFM